MLDSLGVKDQNILKVAMELERIALQDDYFVEKKLYPNIDFYSGITLRAMGFPMSMFTALFAVARTVGWVAQWKEMIEDPEQKIGRPRQLYIGADRAPLRPRRPPRVMFVSSTRHPGGRCRCRGHPGPAVMETLAIGPGYPRLHLERR